MDGGTGDPLGSRSTVKIFANIFISFIGAGVLGLPFAFKEAGIIEGVIIMTSVGIISVKAMLLLIDCKDSVLLQDRGRGSQYVAVSKSPDGYSESDMDDSFGDGLVLDHIQPDSDLLIAVKDQGVPKSLELSYGDVGEYALGRLGRLLVNIAIVVSQTGFCCAYLIFISENLSDYISGLSLIHWLLIILPPLCLLTFLRHLSHLAITSLLAQFSNLLAFAVVIWFDFEHLHNVEVHPTKMSLKGFPFFLAIAIYCYEGAGMILSLESSVAKDVRYKFKKIFITTMVIVTIMYVAFGACGYLSFGSHTNPIITLNLPKGSSVDLAMIVKFCLCLGLFFTYPVMIFPVTKILEKFVMPGPQKNLWKGNFLRLGVVVLTGAVVMMIPNFANLMALVGATCCTLLAFVLPAVFHLSICKGNITKCGFVFDSFLIFVGVTGTLLGTIDAFRRLMSDSVLLEDDIKLFTNVSTVEDLISTITTINTSTVNATV